MMRVNYAVCAVWLMLFAVLLAAPLEPQERDVPLQGMVELASEPTGAEVYAGATLLGRTPMRVRRAMLDSVRVWFPSRDAWDAQVLRPDSAAVSADVGVTVLRFDATRLLSAKPLGDAAIVGKATVRDDGFRLPPTDVLLPAALGLAAGAASVIFKQHADGLYEDYLRTGDESLLSQTKKYDIYAGVSLALLQVGLGYFIYRLFGE